LTYSKIQRVVDISRVGGPGISSFETAFHRTSPWTYRYVVIPLRLEKKTPKALKKNSWLASNRLAAHFSIANCILYGSRVFTVSSYIGGEGVTMETLKGHGLTEEMFTLQTYWSALLPKMSEADFAYLKKLLKRIRRGHHYQSEDIPVLIKENGVFKIQPHRIMGRANGKDKPTYFVQEGGSMLRKQRITAGESLQLVNPYQPQPPQVYIRVTEKNTQPLVNPRIEVGNGYVQIRGSIAPHNYLFYDGTKQEAVIYDRNWNILHKVPVSGQHFVMPKGTARVCVRNSDQTNRAGKINLEVQFVTLGPKYTLEANKALIAAGKRIP
ncbi:MAG: hypothetical protein D6820_03240, partial [Lentisphaerae bacterium]